MHISSQNSRKLLFGNKANIFGSKLNEFLVINHSDYICIWWFFFMLVLYMSNYIPAEQIIVTVLDLTYNSSELRVTT